MKKFFLALLLLVASSAFAQGATRNVVLSWTLSASSSVTGYSIYQCTVPSGATSCTPSLTGTPVGTVGGAVTTYICNCTIGSAYGYSVVAMAPACTPTTPLTTPCGSAAADTVTYVPVPPQTAGASNVVIVVP